MGQLHLNQCVEFCAGLELDRHVIVEYTHATLAFNLPKTLHGLPQLPWIKGLLRGEALLFASHVVLAHFAEVTFEQVAIDSASRL